ncbi:MAG: hypothetical protein RIS34_1680 [Pseudomonadota bacterium]|jgi:hypothetical protein
MVKQEGGEIGAYGDRVGAAEEHDAGQAGEYEFK